MTFVDQPLKHLHTRIGPLACREIHEGRGTPLLMLTHLSATLDNWDPYLIDLLARNRHVITVDLPGTGASGGSPASTIVGMTSGIASFIEAGAWDQVDVLGMSMGGFIAQELALTRPEQVRKLILVGTGPAGGEGIAKVPWVTLTAILKATFTRKDPRNYLFFPPTVRDNMGGYFERQHRWRHPGAGIKPAVFFKQLHAIRSWGNQRPQDLGRIYHETLVVNGEQDIMVPTDPNTFDLARRIPNATLAELYSDAGHAPLFQEPERFAHEAVTFLDG